MTSKREQLEDMPFSQLLNEEDDDLYFATNMRLLAKLTRGEESLSETERTLNLVYDLASEVSNGGYAQYFFNSSGDYAVETFKALQRLGLTTAARIHAEALSVFPNGKPSSDRRERWRQKEVISVSDKENWERLSSALWRDDDTWPPVVAKFIRLHKDDINPPRLKPGWMKRLFAEEAKQR